jgi:hypothetical protein
MMNSVDEVQSETAWRAMAASSGEKTNDDIIEQAGDLIGTVAIAHGLPVDFEGVSISVLREPGTNRLLACILSPVDMHSDEPYPRYSVDPDHVATVKPRKLIVPV